MDLMHAYGQTDRQTDRQADRRTTYCGITALCIASRGNDSKALAPSN